ncbi:NnrU family protein [Novosphingobium jiangmenense]|uniref:MFS transporter n=1 Tax=Novosphingobium jiangmenense TaxID=2791981 RepID=A0ABS0HG32_9SPHN|nr:NnrU family protein [Novosphingobium jiangmenense]MBF9150906.1 MFS transporter [Novosphingobium jiangmenense]
MDPALIHLVVATAGFVGTHFLMSGPLRPTLASALGSQGFLLLYSLVSIGTFAWAVVVFDRAPADGALWNGMSVAPWALASILTITALALLIPSFARNPALPGKSAAGVGTWIPVGVFRVTRHPMMWGIALWALGHMIASPTPRVLILMAGLILLALLGSHFQDKRKVAQNKREFSPWQRRTTFWPQLRELAGLKTIWLLAFLVWFIATWLHYHLFGIPAGLWMWVG